MSVNQEQTLLHNEDNLNESNERSGTEPPLHFGNKTDSTLKYKTFEKSLKDIKSQAKQQLIIVKNNHEAIDSILKVVVLLSALKFLIFTW